MINRKKDRVNDVSIKEKLSNAKNSNWITEGLPESEVKSLVEQAKIAAQMERRRLDMKMKQKECDAKKID